MGIKSFLIDKWDKLFNKSKALPKGDNIVIENINTDSIPNNLQKKDTNDVFPKVNIESYPKIGTLDFAIEQYIAGLVYQQKNGELMNSYRVLTQLSSVDNTNSGNNYNNQKLFLDNVSNKRYNRNMEIYEQKKNDGVPSFYHVSTKGFVDNHIDRVYLNCKSENVASLADKFAKEFGNTEYYFKFNADEAKARRSEQFVFYIDDNVELNRVLQTIERTSQKYPKLFEGSKNINPFMKNVGGFIAYAPEVRTGKYNTLNGKSKDIDCSYNSLLSEALQDSLLHSVRPIVAKDLNLTQKLQGEYFEDLSPYVITGTLNEIYLEGGERKKELIDNMKKYLTISQQKNSELDIKGIDVKERDNNNIR